MRDVARERADPTRVGAAGWLDVDDVGAEIAEDLAAQEAAAGR